MRALYALFATLVLNSTALTARADRFPELHPDSDPKVWEQYLKLTEQLAKNPPYLTPDRLPEGYKIGRCLLEVKGRTYVSGKCAYSISKGGEFEFHGPRQVYRGVDFPNPGGGPLDISTDHFVQIDLELNGDGTAGPGWQAFWNEDKRATHAQDYLGPVTRKGACYTNPTTRICLWKS